MRKPERGLAAATIIVLLVLGVVAALLGSRYFDAGLVLDQRGATDAGMRRAQQALAQYVMLNQRLPCPANGADDSGTASPPGATVSCNFPDGVVPWSSLALRREDIVDGWGRKISYRVFDGPTGLTQAGGASMTDCNANASATDPIDGSGLCPAAHKTPPSAYLSGKGLSIQTDSGTQPGFAYLLISHGESGLGAFAAQGAGRSTLPPPGSLERANVLAASPYNARTRSAPGVLPTDANFFDDTVTSVPIADLIKTAMLTERDWGNVTPPSVFTAATIAAAGGTVDYNTGRGNMNFSTFSVSAYGDTGDFISFDVAAGAGIGVIGSGVNANQFVGLDREINEGLRFQFSSASRYLGITLSHFGAESTEFDQVSFDFVNGGSTIRVSKVACRGGDGKANFTVSPGFDFNEVKVEARVTNGGSFYSNFVIADIKQCSASPCLPASAVPADNCP